MKLREEKCKTYTIGLNLQNVKIRVDNNKVIKIVNKTTLWNPKVFELWTISWKMT